MESTLKGEKFNKQTKAEVLESYAKLGFELKNLIYCEAPCFLWDIDNKMLAVDGVSQKTKFYHASTCRIDHLNINNFLNKTLVVVSTGEQDRENCFKRFAVID